MSNKTPGVGLISVGWMGKVHTRAYQALPMIYPELGIAPRLVMAADTAADRVAYATDTLGYASGTTDYHELLANHDIDVVSICAPNFLHKEMGVAAAKAGKAFWIEKPVGRGATETSAVREAARTAGVTTSIGFNYRHTPALEEAKRLIANGTLGRITNVRGSFFADYSSDPRGALSWRFVREYAGNGVLGDLMGHLVDLMHYLVGPITEVSGLTETVYKERPELPIGTGTHFAVIENGPMKPVENEDYAAMLVRFGSQPNSQPSNQPSAPVGTLEASRVSVGTRASYGIEIYGTEGSLRWNFERLNELELAQASHGNHIGYTTIMAGPGFGDFGRFQPGAGTGMGYDDLKVIEARKFLQAYYGLAHENSTVDDALAAALVLDAAEESAASRAWVAVRNI